MPLSTINDRLILQSWSFITNYGHNRQRFIEVARIVYQALGVHLGPIHPMDLEQPLAVALLGTAVFTKTCAGKPHLSPAFYPTIAGALARHMIDTDWGPIVAP